MREQIVHSVWIISHFIRTALESRASESLAFSLAEEVRVLQAELHRTQRVLSGYSAIVTSLENKQKYHASGNLFFFLVVVVLGAVWLWLKCRATPPRGLPLTLSDTGGSSDSDNPPVTDLVVSRRSGGPLRPSQLGKGRK